IALAKAPHILQQHGFVHAGVLATLADTACGFAALTLMPASAGVLTVEFKINLMAPAAAERLVAHGRVVRAGRTLLVTEARIAPEDAPDRPVALLTATMMTIEGRDGIVD
ncbi:MAG: PaaI family thioesterase, partial [Methylobacteriaceae bacterium]|nr:PaaI family thioesterase [Methylobacteriaceae bacterium]